MCESNVNVLQKITSGSQYGAGAVAFEFAQVVPRTITHPAGRRMAPGCTSPARLARVQQSADCQDAPAAMLLAFPQPAHAHRLSLLGFRENGSGSDTGPDVLVPGRQGHRGAGVPGEAGHGPRGWRHGGRHGASWNKLKSLLFLEYVWCREVGGVVDAMVRA